MAHPVAPRLLILEDEDAIAFALQRYLARRGYEVDCAREVEDAAALVATRDYALVVTDLLVGGAPLAGLEFVDRLRDLRPRPLSVLLTARGSNAVEDEARARGVDRVLHKPTSLADLANEIARLLGAA